MEMAMRQGEAGREVLYSSRRKGPCWVSGLFSESVRVIRQGEARREA